jgi:hypothetical protein
MKLCVKHFIIVCLLQTSLLVFACQKGANSTSEGSKVMASDAINTQLPDSSRVKIANDVYDNLKVGSYDKVTSYFNETLLLYLDSKKLEQTWTSIIGQVGALETKLEVSANEPTKTVYVKCKFEKTPLYLKLVFDQDSKVAGIFFLPNKD